MKAKEYDQVRTLVDVKSGSSDATLSAGTVGTVVDAPGEGEPEVYSVDVGEEGSYDHIELEPDQFEVIEAS